MGLPRCFCPDLPADGHAIALSENESHHLLDVLRARPGDALELLDGCGRRAQAHLESIGRAKRPIACVRVEQVTQAAAPPRPVIVLWQALAKGDHMDLLAEKCTELGVSEIVPIRSERAVVRDAGPARLARWRRIVLGALKQSGNPWLPRIAEPATFAELATPPGVLLVASLALEPAPVHLLDALLPLRASPPPQLTIAIGPEGDFTPEELAGLQTRGALPVSLGPHVLRTETAALLAVGLAAQAFG